MSDRPSKTGRQLQSVAKQFGSIGKTVSADSDSDSDETIAIDADNECNVMIMYVIGKTVSADSDENETIAAAADDDQ